MKVEKSASIVYIYIHIHTYIHRGGGDEGRKKKNVLKGNFN